MHECVFERDKSDICLFCLLYKVICLTLSVPSYLRLFPVDGADNLEACPGVGVRAF